MRHRSRNLLQKGGQLFLFKVTGPPGSNQVRLTACGHRSLEVAQVVANQRHRAEFDAVARGITAPADSNIVAPRNVRLLCFSIEPF